MEIIHLLEYNRTWDLMYSYYTKEYCWLKRFCLRIDGKFQDEEIYNDVYELSKWDIITLIKQYASLYSYNK